ncbi:MAG TPA: M28 family peptidase [Vicinamibacterales bacterium]|nr:M28 family peptidase [Vicinamibacterales bacterium]
MKKTLRSVPKAATFFFTCFTAFISFMYCSRAAELPASAPTATSAPAAQAPAFDSSKAWEHLRQMVAIGPRPAGSAALRQTRAYITRQLASYGLTVQEQPFQADSPIGRVEMVNLIVRLPGKRADRILFTGHYDTKLFREFKFVGASDGASSGAFLIELARVLKDAPKEFTYEIVWFDGEEAFCKNWTECGKPNSPDNTYGSRYYVQAAEKANAIPSIRAMMLFDMIGAKDLKIDKETEYSAPWLTEIVWAQAARLGHTSVFQNVGGSIEDDHVAFSKAGIPTIDLIDLNNYPQWHTADDDLNHVAARSLQIVGDVVLASLPEIEKRLAKQ